MLVAKDSKSLVKCNASNIFFLECPTSNPELAITKYEIFVFYLKAKEAQAIS